ncbi:glycosyltransferase family 9 protein [Gillisia xinjiangensis]|uniref:glycosyltransferase family 9 protein n=1 Tax=Gillisia xinjiangensis TaxID=3384765 RepID=UPI00391B9CE7
MIGDVLTSSILFEALRDKYPEAELHYLIYPRTRPVVENNPFIDKLILFEDSDKKPLNFISFLQKMKKEKYEVVIDVYSKIGTAFISWFSGAKLRISFNKWYTRFFYSDVFDRNIISKTKGGLAIEKRVQLLQPLHKNFPAEIKPKIYLTAAEISFATQILSGSGINAAKPLVMISVLGSSKNKTYPPEFLAVLLNKIIEETEAQLLFNYIPSQMDEARNIYELCNEKTQKHIHLDIFGKSLREFMALTSQCDALIGNEGGAVNMAKAMKIPTFAIFSPSVNKEHWNVYEDEITNVSVHLQDFVPEIFLNKSKKELHSLNAEFYTKFKPELISAKLHQFLQRIKP